MVFFIQFYLFILGGCAGSWLLHRLFSSGGESGPLPSCGVWASHCGGFSCCRAWALGPSGFRSCTARSQYLWFLGSSACMGLIAMQHVDSSWIRDSNPCLFYWQADFFTTEPPGKLSVLSLLSSSTRNNKDFHRHETDYGSLNLIFCPRPYILVLQLLFLVEISNP